jgi:tetratricopeptide (TPR) repeat protein
VSDLIETRDDSTEALMGEIVDDFLERIGDGGRPDIEEYARRYPDLATILRQMLPALRAIHSSAADAARAPGGPASGIELEGPPGDFQIVREIGRGGMGVVYEAVQASLGRRVALKLLPFSAALDARQRQRFQNEAHAAAHLHHQNIVPVYTVGCQRGVHFYAMQFIEGRTLAALIEDLRSLAGMEPDDSDCPRGPASRLIGDSIPGRIMSAPGRSAVPRFGEDSTPAAVDPGTAGTPLGPAAPAPREARAAVIPTAHCIGDPRLIRTAAHLAMQAAEALEHAHGRGVVHRDVKPANLLVDGQGNLWVTDFGLAHVLTGTRLTLTGDLVGTLRYMSPEQALAHPGEVDHRTDIYSLGATLYELLTLEPAFDGRRREELLRQVAFEEPLPPRRLSRAIPGELETIVLKAIAKDPAGRYATAREFADDLRRFLEDKPIRARRPSRLERARKWVRRHRPAVWSVAVASIVTLTILGAGVGWVLRTQAARRAKLAADLRSALEEGRRAQRAGQWAQAHAVGRRAEALLMDGGAAPAVAERVRDLLRELDDEEADSRLVALLQEVRLLQADVHVKENRFALERARPEYRRAFDRYGLRAGATTPDEAATRLRRRPPPIRGIAVTALDHWLILARHEAVAEVDWLERVLSLADSDAWRQRLRAAQRTGDRRALEELARDVDAAAQPPEALFLLHRALHQCGVKGGAVTLLRRAQEAFPGDFWINHNLGMALQDCDPPRAEESIRFLTAAMALRPESPGVRLNLGLALWNNGRLDEALAAFRRAVELRRDYADAHRGLGVVLLAKGRLDEALAAFRRAVELRPDVADAHYNLGNALFRGGNLGEAIVAFRRAIELRPDDAETHSDLGLALCQGRRIDEALAIASRAIDLDPDSPKAHYNLGYILKVNGQLDEAIAAYRRAIDLDPDRAETRCNLGTALDGQGRVDEALAAFRRAITLKPDLVGAHFNLGLVLAREGRLDEAVAALRQTAELAPDHAPARYNLGNALRDQGRLGEAAAAYRRAIELKPDYAEAYCNLGGALRQQAEFALSLAALVQGHELGLRRPDWPYPSALWVREARLLLELDGRMRSVVRGEVQPADSAEQNPVRPAVLLQEALPRLRPPAGRRLRRRTETGGLARGWPSLRRRLRGRPGRGRPRRGCRPTGPRGTDALAEASPGMAACRPRGERQAAG